MQEQEKLEQALKARDFVRALDVADTLGEVALVRVWSAMKARRALMVGVETWQGEALKAAKEALAAPASLMLPMRGSYEELEAQVAELGQRGDVVELARCHLGLADAVERVDLRVGHVEAAAMLADQLGEPGLQLLCIAYLARLDVSFGEDDDAESRISELRERCTKEGAWLALLIALELAARRDDADADLESQLLRARLGSEWEKIWPRHQIWAW